VFLTWEWMDVWCRVQRRNRTPYIVTARLDGRLAGLAPLVTVPRRLGPWRLQTLEFMGGGVGADHLTFLAVRERGDLLSAAVRFLADQRTQWDLLDLARIDEGLARRFIAEFSDDDRFRLVVAPSDISPVLSLPESWHALAAALKSDLPAKIDYYHRRLAREIANVRFHRVEDDATFDLAWGDLVRLHTRRWRERGLRGAFADETFERFHRQFARRALQRGWLRLYRLEVDGHGVAVLYCLQMRERVSYVQGGFDPAMGRYSVGTLLVAHAIREAIEEHAREFDFLRGAEPYKMRWATSVRQDYHLRLIPKRHRSIMALAWLQQSARVRGRLKAVMNVAGSRLRSAPKH